MRTSSVGSFGAAVMAALLTGMMLPDAQAAQQRGVVTAISVVPSATQTGTPVTASVTGTNPCGAVHIDWGDGTAITYAIVDVPVTQKHTYSKSGNYTVVARGMGNCDGQASAQLRMDPAPAPPEPAPRLHGIEITPNPATAPAAVTITVAGTGKCTYTLDFGDGNSERRTASLPDQVRHTYPAPNIYYPLAATGQGPCEGLVRRNLTVNAPESAPRLHGIEIAPNPATAPATVTITVTGTGKCSYLLDFGDGNSERRAASLPDRVQHTYPAPNTSYPVVANAEGSCGGLVRRNLTVNAPAGPTPARGLTRLVIAPNPATVRTRVTITVEGSGTCPVTVDFDDGTDQTIEAPLPARITHTYSGVGVYEIYAWADTPCSGEATATVQVRQWRVRGF